jgi:predicted dehydrogenase
MNPANISRRRFIGTAAAAAAAAAAAPWIRSAPAPDSPFRNLVTGRKIRVASVGLGGKGYSDTHECIGEDIVALCDVDFERGAQTFHENQQAARYRDFRQMLDEMGDRIDAVNVSTPDHMHFPIAMMALERGKHVYVQKPLTHTIGEARALAAAAARAGVVTQMGNQGHANNGTRLVREWIAAGVIGPVREVHCWTNRPVWPQPVVWPGRGAAPDTIDWNLWLGVAPEREYMPGIAPFNWRGLWDYGTGALGDMGCHLMDAAFWALDLSGPVKIEATSTGNTAVSAPKSSKVVCRFPARGSMPPVVFTWYDGGEVPPRPPELEAEIEMPKGGTYYRGDNGVIFSPTDYCEEPRLIPEERMKNADLPKRTIARVPRANPHQEWLDAIKGGPVPGSNIPEYSAGLTEFVLLGNLAIRLNRPIEWDSKAGACVGLPEADALIHKSYRVF